ncbi:maleylpyruvate isomerase family mycothiol-dependent enzyme [Mycobacterium sp. NPDC003449]
MDDNTLLAQLQTDVIAIQAVALADRDLTGPVPTCPGWTIADLLGHLWSIQSWVRQILRTREVGQIPDPATDPTQAVADFIDGIPDYLTAMRAIDADEPCWGLGPKPRRAGFWIRRQAHEHAVHHADLHRALGTDPELDPAFAADGADEILSIMYPRQVRLGRSEPVADPIRFRTTDTGDEWTIGDGEPTATVTATAADLYLGLWKRLDLLDNSRIEGDRDAVHRALKLALGP